VQAASKFAAEGATEGRFARFLHSRGMRRLAHLQFAAL